MSHHCEDIHCRADSNGCVADLDRVHQVLDDVVALTRAGSFRSASRRFGDLRLTLEPHMKMIEAGAFLELDGCARRHPSRKLRQTHAAIHKLLDALGAALSEDARERIEADVAALRACLAAHHAEEQQQLIRLARSP